MTNTRTPRRWVLFCDFGGFGKPRFGWRFVAGVAFLYGAGGIHHECVIRQLDACRRRQQLHSRSGWRIEFDDNDRRCIHIDGRYRGGRIVATDNAELYPECGGVFVLSKRLPAVCELCRAAPASRGSAMRNWRGISSRPAPMSRNLQRSE